MKNFELVIGGGGLRAAGAIKSYRESRGSGPITLVSKESDLPYHRPALSKRYLSLETTVPMLMRVAAAAKRSPSFRRP